MMPISTPDHMVEFYSGDGDHFIHILEHLIVPAVKMAGFIPLLPTFKGSVLIHSEIIRRICLADMAVADMSILNANVFFEMGLRTAINKPMALLKDDKTIKVPFDAGLIHYHQYNSSASSWLIESEISKIAEHLNESWDLSNENNSMWEAFNASRHFDTEKNTNSLEKIREEIEYIRRLQTRPLSRITDHERAEHTAIDVFTKLSEIATDAGYFVDIGNSNNRRIEIKMSKSKAMPPTMRKILEKSADRYGYRLIFV